MNKSDFRGVSKELFEEIKKLHEEFDKAELDYVIAMRDEREIKLKQQPSQKQLLNDSMKVYNAYIKYRQKLEKKNVRENSKANKKSK